MAAKNNTEISRLLIEKGADIDAKNDNGDTRRNYFQGPP